MKNIQDVVENILKNGHPQVIKFRTLSETFELYADPALSSNLSGNVGAFIVRALLNKIGVEEQQVLQWRPEHKFIQYQILNYYIPGCMPETFSLTQLLGEKGGRKKVRTLCNRGYFIKAALGDSSGRSQNFDRTTELEEIISSHNQGMNEDKWILQKRLNVFKEFRVHTFQKDVLYGLTMLMTDLDSSFIPSIDEMIKPILDKLPDSILGGTLIGWDIAVTTENELYIIEANFTGYHTDYHPGFQTSGYFGDFYYGSMMCAWLNNYFRTNYNVSITSVEQTLLSSSDFYKEFMFYNHLFSTEQWDHLNKSRNGNPGSAIIYLGEDVNCLITKLLDFFQLGSFAKAYYLIVYPESFFSVSSLFCRNKLIKVMGEQELFVEDDLKIISQLAYDVREKECCNRLQSILKDEICFIVR